MRFGRYILRERLEPRVLRETWLADVETPDEKHGPVVVTQIDERVTGATGDNTTHRAFCDALISEGRKWMRVRDPHLARIVDVGFVGGRYYVTREHIPGLDLRRAVEAQIAATGRPFELDRAAEILAQLARALRTLHGLDGRDGWPEALTHGSVAPHNIVLADDGRVVLLESEQALPTRGFINLTSVGSLPEPWRVGYLSPEQIRQEPFDARADLFAAAGVGFFLLTGHDPYEAPHVMAVFQRIVSGARITVPKMNVPAPFERFILHAHAPEISRRVQSAAELVEAMASLSPRP